MRTFVPSDSGGADREAVVKGMVCDRQWYGGLGEGGGGPPQEDTCRGCGDGMG